MLKSMSTILPLVASMTLAAIPSQETLIAHRGESADAPENTLPAYRLAVERGFGFECDIYLSADKRIFTFHDADLKRTTDGASTKKCHEATWDELQKLDVGGWGRWKGTPFSPQRPALLEEVLDLARDGRTIYVEVKHGTEIVPYIKEILLAQKKANPGNMLFISFNREVCLALKKELPQYRVYLLQGAKATGAKDSPPITADALLEKVQGTPIDGVDVQFDPECITSEFIHTLRDAGFEFHVWTVDRLDHALLAFDRGAQTVTTNCARQLLEEYQARQPGH
ncbi:MAG: glycerophosphodiester phosphodiesterase [Oligosphaeraceae bacterium]